MSNQDDVERKIRAAIEELPPFPEYGEPLVDDEETIEVHEAGPRDGGATSRAKHEGADA